MLSKKRRRLFIDRPIQSALLMRVTLYWALSVLVQLSTIFFFWTISSSWNDFYANSSDLWRYLQLAVFASILTLPMILLDIVKLSHRWVGPMFRMRASLQQLSRGESVAPIRFRESDFWQEVAGDLNVIVLELQQLRGTVAADSANRVATTATGDTKS